MNVRINQNLSSETFFLVSHHYASLKHFEIAATPCGYYKPRVSRYTPADTRRHVLYLNGEVKVNYSIIKKILDEHVT